ncbi:MAG TPA: hypothetical protein PLF50_00400 [Candidatus Cloacimonadota bacterium]|nr:hypothetical protein [Candidatus Cloacimonadota bacterium]
MVRISLAFIILLLFISCIYADDIPSEEAKRQAKERQMEQIASRFKAETGFSGEIGPNGALSNLGIWRGNFADIQFSANEDTTSFRQACNRIIDKLLPYTLATRSQLSMSRISNNLGRTETEYCQTVNGYRVENGGLILIAYDAGRYRFSISNGTVELPSQTITPILTYEDAVRIYDDNVKDDETIKNIRERRPFLGLRYCNIFNEWEGDTRTEYRLCWTGGYTRTIYVDAQTGQVYKIVDMTIDDK